MVKIVYNNRSGCVRICDNTHAKKMTENNLGGIEPCINSNGTCDKTTRSTQCKNATKIGDSGCGTIDSVNYSPQYWEKAWLNPKLADKTLILKPSTARGSWCGWNPTNTSENAPYAIGVCLKIEPQPGFKPKKNITPPTHYMIAVDNNAFISGSPANQFADIHTNTSYPGGTQGQQLIDDYSSSSGECMKNTEANNNALKWTVVDPSFCYTTPNAKDIIPFYKNSN